MRISAVLLILCIFPTFASAAADSTDHWTAENPLRVGLATDLQPASFTLTNGQFGGWGADMMTLGALKADVSIEFVPYNAVEDGVAMLQNGTVHALGPLGERPDLTAFATMNRAWSWTPVVLVTNGDHDWATVDDARGRISTISGSPLEGLLETQFGHMESLTYDTPSDGVQALANGTIDAYVGPLAIIGHQIQFHQLTGLRPVGDALSLVEVGFWAQDPLALDAVDQIRAAITGDEAKLLYVKWTGFDLSEPTTIDTGLPRWVGFTAIGLAAAAILGIMFNFLLRKQVRTATKEIAELNTNLEARVDQQTQELRRASDRLQTMLSASPIGIAVTTPAGNIETANEALGELLGYSIDELQGDNFSSLNLWADHLDRTDILGKIREGIPIRHRLVRLRHKGGEERQAEVTFDLLDVGGTTRILGTAMDVTSREQARESEEQRQRAQSELEFSRKMQQFAVDLINRTVHQMATPLTPLALGVTVLKGKLGTEYADDLALLERNLQRLRQNLGALTTASNLQAASLSTGSDHLEARATLVSVAELHAGMAAEKGIALTVDAQDHRIIAEGSRLQLALGHLVGNALKYTPRGGKVSLRATRTEDHVRLEVEDNGPGIAAGDLEKLWLPHEQLGKSSLATSGGAGLGLFVTRRLIDLEGGQTGCQSTEGKGSTFWIELPAVDEEF